MKNTRKIIVQVLLLAAFVLMAFLISLTQSNKAQVELLTNGLSTETKTITSVNHDSVRDLVNYLEQQYPKEKIQLQLKNKHVKEQFLIWANYQLPELPVTKGRSFDLADFNGEISFAILSQNSQAEIRETQNNRYLKYQDSYLSVIGTLKENYQENNYYVTTGPNQRSAYNALQNYEIFLDGLTNAQAKKVAQHFDGKITNQSSIKKIVAANKSPLWLLFVAIVLAIIILVLGAFLTVLTKRELIDAKLHGELKLKLRLNLTIKFLASLVIIILLASIISYYAFYYSNFFDYLIIALLLLGLILIYYVLQIYLSRNQRINK